MAVSIEIFGVKGYQYDVLRSSLAEKLDQAGVIYEIHDVQKIDEFIAEGIESVPAIRVNHGRHFTKTEDKSAEEISESVYQYILANVMEYVICPIDFSDHSLQAAAWGYRFAHVLGMRMKLLHVYRPLTEAQYTIPVDSAGMVRLLENRLTQTAKDLEQAYPEGTPIVKELAIGDPLLHIVRMSRDASSGMVVMGTLGESNVIRKVFGVVSSSVLRHAYTPVILVPPNTTFHPPRNIMIGFHHELIANGALQKLITLNTTLQAHLQFVHIQQSPEDYREIRDRLLDRLTEGSNPAFSFDVREINVGDTPLISALLEYAAQTKPDMIVLVTRHRSNLRRLFDPGVTSRVALNTKWPMLVIHTG